MSATLEHSSESMPVQPQGVHIGPTDVFRTISLWRSLHGYDNGDYDRYRRFCTRRIQRLRKSLPLTTKIRALTPKEKSTISSNRKNRRNIKLKIRTLPFLKSNDDKDNDSKSGIHTVLNYCLLLSERSLTAIAAVEKQINGGQRSSNALAKNYMMCQLRNAIKGLEAFLQHNSSASQPAHPATVIMVKCLLCGVKGQYFYLKGEAQDALEQFVEGILSTRAAALEVFVNEVGPQASSDQRELSIERFRDHLVQRKFIVVAEKNISPSMLESTTQRVLQRVAEYGLNENLFTTTPGEMSISICDEYTIVVREEPIIVKLIELEKSIDSNAQDGEEIDLFVDTLVQLKTDIETFMSSCGLRQTTLSQVVSVLDMSRYSRCLGRVISDLDRMIKFELDELVTAVCKHIVFFADKNDTALHQLADFQPALGFKRVADSLEIINAMIESAPNPFTKSLVETKNIMLNLKCIYSAILLLFEFQSQEAYTLARLASQRENDLAGIECPTVTYKPLIQYNDLMNIFTTWEPIIRLQAARLEAICLTLCRIGEMRLENNFQKHQNEQLKELNVRPFPPNPVWIPPAPIMYNLVSLVSKIYAVLDEVWAD